MLVGSVLVGQLVVMVEAGLAVYKYRSSVLVYLKTDVRVVQ